MEKIAGLRHQGGPTPLQMTTIPGNVVMQDLTPIEAPQSARESVWSPEGTPQPAR